MPRKFSNPAACSGRFCSWLSRRSSLRRRQASNTLAAGIRHHEGPVPGRRVNVCLGDTGQSSVSEVTDQMSPQAGKCFATGHSSSSPHRVVGFHFSSRAAADGTRSAVRQKSQYADAIHQGRLRSLKNSNTCMGLVLQSSLAGPAAQHHSSVDVVRFPNYFVRYLPVKPGIGGG